MKKVDMAIEAIERREMYGKLHVITLIMLQKRVSGLQLLTELAARYALLARESRDGFGDEHVHWQFEYARLRRNCSQIHIVCGM